MMMACWSRREDLMSDIFMLQTQLPLSQRFSFPAVGRLFQWSNPFRTLNYHGRRQPALLVIWTLLFIGYFPTSMQTDQQVGQGETWPSNDQECPTCAREKTLSLLKEDEVKRWRIESTKQQILDRLEMEDRPPRVKTKEIGGLHLHNLPPTIVLPSYSRTISSSFQSLEVEPARQIILFPTKIFRRNKNHQPGETLTIKFPITDEMIDISLLSAVLWTAQASSGVNTTTASVDWQSTDVTTTVDRQIELHGRHRFLSLPVDTSLHLDHPHHPKPYLVIQLDASVKRLAEVSSRISRQKRNTTPRCGATVTQCCRESLFVSFKDVGWDDWIVAPAGFHAFYCRGSCRTFTAPAASANTHTSLLQKLVSRERVPAEARPHLAPCCAPTRLSPLTIFYSDENNVIKQRTLQNMIVESCGCTL